MRTKTNGNVTWKFLFLHVCQWMWQKEKANTYYLMSKCCIVHDVGGQVCLKNEFLLIIRPKKNIYDSVALEI
jgi:hypothetical protein